MNSYEVIDEKEWKRAMHCAVFRDCIEPAFCVTFELDITNFLKKIRKQNYSFTMALVFVVSKCANEIEEFRYRFLDGKVVLFDKIDTAFTYLDKETELFKVVNVPGCKDGNRTEGIFYRTARKRHVSVFAYAVGIIYAYIAY